MNTRPQPQCWTLATILPNHWSLSWSVDCSHLQQESEETGISGNIWPSHIQFKAKCFAGSTWSYWGVARILEQNKSSQLVTIINNWCDFTNNFWWEKPEDDERAGDSVMKSEVEVYALGGRGGFLCIVAEERGVFGVGKFNPSNSIVPTRPSRISHPQLSALRLQYKK